MPDVQNGGFVQAQQQYCKITHLGTHLQCTFPSSTPATALDTNHTVHTGNVDSTVINAWYGMAGLDLTCLDGWNNVAQKEGRPPVYVCGRTNAPISAYDHLANVNNAYSS